MRLVISVPSYPIILNCSGTVSYPHLDVYKRQLVYRIGMLDAQYGVATAIGLFKSVISFAMLGISYMVAYKSVSYTHLDVYKRQAYYSQPYRSRNTINTQVPEPLKRL